MQPVAAQDERPNQGIYDEAYYLTRFKTGEWPAIVRDTVYLTHRTQFAATRPSGPQSKLMVPRAGTSTPRDRVEVLSFLTAPADVRVDVGATGQTYQAEAGAHATSFPLAVGNCDVSVVRSGATVAAVASPWTVVQTPVVQDLQYHASGSRRP
jgi:hypothetical protein